MTSAETVTEVKDIVLIVFLVFSFVILVFASILSLRLYRRASSFMDRIELLADGFEETFGRVAVARKAVEDAASVLKPMATGLGLIGAFQGFGRLFGTKKPAQKNQDDE
jgi:hypothetical protein